MNVIFADWLLLHFYDFDDDIRFAIAQFTTHVKKHGLKGLPGRNKSSVVPNPHTRREHRRHAIATKYCLWHYHLGVPHYVGEWGDMTSAYILHYIRYETLIVLPTF